MQHEFATISPKGIGRNTPDRSTPDGALLEAINVRFKDGAWRGVGDKQATGYFAEALFEFDGITYHPALPVNTYVVHNSADNKVYKILFTNGDAVQVSTAVLTLATGEVFDRFSHLGNVLLVFTDIKKHILYWDKISETYKDLTFLPVPVVNVSEIATESVDIPTINFTYDISGGVTQAEMAEYARNLILGDYYKKLNDKQKDGYIEGFVIVRLAYRLFDGSYILHSQPYLHHIGYNATTKPNMPFTFSFGDGTVALTDLPFAKLAVYYNFFNTGVFSIPDFESMGVVESLDVFCSAPINAFDLSKEISEWVSDLPYYENNVPPFNSDQIAKIMDQLLYKVKSVPLSDILIKVAHNDGTTGLYYNSKAGVIYPDMTKDITSNELLPVDNSSHHMINSMDDYQFNSKLHLSNIFTKLSSGYNCLYHSDMLGIKGPGNNGYEQNLNLLSDADKRAKFLGDYITADGVGTSTFKIFQQVWIKTDKGRKVITSELKNSWVETYDASNIPATFKYYAYYYTDTVTKTALIFNPIISYPDYRAYKIRFYYENSGTKSFLADYDLKSLATQNIAYHISDLETSDGSTGMNYPIILSLPDDPFTITPMPTDSPTDDPVIEDTNRMQVSEIFNPFIWPAINSYRFGQIHNVLIAISGVQQAMSDSAFGQYPLYIFSQEGIFTIQQGTDVLYQSIQPLNNEVLLNRNCLISISGAIVFGTKEGLRLISGSHIEELSIDVEGAITNPLASNFFYVDALSGSRLPVINAYRSNVSFLTYLAGAKLFYDIENKELIVSNASYNYSYAYSFYTQSWFTRTEVYVNSMIVAGRQIAVKRSSEVVDENTVYTDSLHYVDAEQYTSGLCDYFLMQTRPVNLGNSANKRIVKLISMCNIQTQDQEYSIQIVAGSNDLETWSIVSYVQYSGYISNVININPVGNFKYFIFAIAGERNGFILTQFDVEFKTRFNNKLR